MAQKADRDLSFEAERNLATLLAAKENIRPPADLWSLLERYASVRWADFPGTCDALLIRHADSRAEVLVRQSSRGKKARLRFTLAHELGHIVIPWQRGSMICHAEGTAVAGDDLARAMEAEANRFASELLLPTAWAREQLRASDDPLAARILDVTATAGVSMTVGVLAAERICDPNTIVAQVDPGTRLIQYEARSWASSCRPFGRGERFDERDYGRVASVSSVECEGKLLVAVEFPPAVEVVVTSDRTAAELLLEALRLAGEGPEQYASIMGVTGAVNGSQRRRDPSSGPEELLAALRARFAGDPRYARVVRQPQFNAYLAMRAAELRPKPLR